MTSFLILDGLSQPITKNNNSRELIRHCVSLASFVRFLQYSSLLELPHNHVESLMVKKCDLVPTIVLEIFAVAKC